MKIKTKLFFFIISLIILNSCGAKKTITEYKEKIVKDSIYITKDRVIVERVLDSIVIDSPCDSLGNLKPFKRTLIIPQGKIDLYSENGNINSNIDLKGYEKVLEKRYQLMYEKKVSEIESKSVSYKTPLWMWLTIILETIIIILLVKLKFF